MPRMQNSRRRTSLPLCSHVSSAAHPADVLETPYQPSLTQAEVSRRRLIIACFSSLYIDFGGPLEMTSATSVFPLELSSYMD
ncbi:hypothetical protein BDN67DRAFT_702798 [Paxillus ammoniavirescens]|nr:hypothetical protein BDN67DRAFT_702798 [Paxillus ammoniavirescens]